MNKSVLVIVMVMLPILGWAQTTVTLQDQCNCEVLKGTDVSSPGATTPTGAEQGDIYVNTTSGSIFFWDGDSWEFTSSDDQQVLDFSFDTTTNILTLELENDGVTTVNLGTLSDTFADTNTTITSFAIDGTNTNLVITDSDSNTFNVSISDLANLINTDDQTLSEVLAQGADANGTVITNLGTPVNPADAATKAYVDGIADDDITGVSFDGTDLTVEEGTTSFSADISALDDSAGVTANATNITTNAGNIATNTANITTNTGNITTNAGNIATNTTNITANTNDIIDLQNDKEDTANKSNDGTLADNSATDFPTEQAVKTYVDTQVAAAADDDITGVSFDGTDLTVEEGTTSFSTDISALDDSAGVAANATNITTNAGNIATNTANITANTNDITDLQNDKEDTANKSNDGTLADNSATDFPTEQAVKTYVDTQVAAAADDDITGVSFDGTDLTVEEGTTSFSADISALDDSAGVAANATNITTNAGGIATNATNITTNAGDITTNAGDIATNAGDIATNAGNITANTTAINNHIAADNDTDATNELTLRGNTGPTGTAVDGTTFVDVSSGQLYVYDSGAWVTVGGSATPGDPSSTNELQNIEEVLTDGNNANGLLLKGLGTPVDPADAATKAYVDGIADDDITGVSFDGTDLTVEEGTTSFSADISALDDSAGVAANSTNITTNAGNIATNTTNITANTNDITDLQNNKEDTANKSNDGTLADNSATDFPTEQAVKTYVDTQVAAAADDDITGVSFDGTDLTVEEGTTSFSADISALDDSAGVAANATNITTNAGNIATNTANITTNTGNITTNAGNIATNTANITANTNDITDLQNDKEDTANKSNDGTLADNSATDFPTEQAVKTYVDTQVAAAADDDITGVSFDGTDLTVEEGTTSFSADISALDDSAGVAANATNITTNAGNIATNTANITTNTGNITTNAGNIATNTTNIATNATNITANASDITDLQNDKEDTANKSNDGTLADNSATDFPTEQAVKTYVDTQVAAAADDDITGVSFDGTDLTVEEGTTSFSADISALDDSAGVAANATNITANAGSIATNTANIATNTGNITTNTGNIATNTTNITANTNDITDLQNNKEDTANKSNDGTLADNSATDFPTEQAVKTYVDTQVAAAADDDITGVSFDGTDLTVEEGTTSFSADISALDDSAGVAANATNITTNTANITANTNDITDLQNDKEDTANKSNDGTLADNSATDFPTEQAVKTYVDTQVAAAADDDITGVSFDGTDLTVEEGTTSFSADISALDDSAGVAANATNITTNAGNIATNTANITTNTGNIATNTTNITANASDITDLQNDKEDTANKSNDGTLADNSATDFPTEQAVKTYVDTQVAAAADDDITGVSFDGTDLTVEEGTTSFSADISALDDSAGVAANATNITTNAGNIATNTANITTNTGNITTNAGNIATNTTNIATNTTNITANASDITDLQNNKEDTANKSNDGTLADNSTTDFPTEQAVKTYVDTQVAAAADDDITGVSFDGTDLTVEEGTTSFSADISALDDSAGVAANATNITTNAGNIATNTANITTNTGNITTNAGNIATNTTNIATNTTNITANASDITDLQNNKEDTANKSNDGTLADNSATDFPTEQAVKTYVDTQVAAAADDDITGVSFDGTDLTVEEGTTSFSADISALDDSAGVAANATNITTNAGNIATNTANITTNTGNITTNAGNIATNTTDIATNTTNITANASDITDLQNDKEDTANKSNDGTLADNSATDFPTEQAVKTYVDTQVAAAADDDITGVSFDGTDLTVEEGTTSFSADISALDDSAGVAANATNITTNAGNIAANTTNIATNTTNITANASDITDLQNDKEDTANKSNDGTLAGNSATDFPTEQAVKTYVDTQVAAAADDDITGVSFDGTDLTVEEGTTSFSADISALDDSAGVAANATNITTNAGNIATNTANITTNTGNITTNAGNIATNTANITANTNDITDLQNDKEDTANKSNDGTLADNSATDFPTEQAVKTYVDAQVSASSVLNDGQIYVGNASNVATGVTASGDATISNAGVIDLTTDAVETDEITDGAVTTGKILDGTIATVDLADDSVTATKINADVAGVGLTKNGTTGALDVTANGSQIDLATPIDIDGDGTNDYTTVEQVLQDVTPVIPAIKAARVFYPPSIAIDASSNVTGATKNLYQEYVNQYAPTAPPFTDTFVRSDVGGADEAPAAIPTYAADELYYYITFYDDSVFDNVSISATGVMTYDIIAQPADYNSLINVVFVVK